MIVDGSPDKRGVVASCSYEARQFSIHSALPSRTAFRLCPQAVFLPARFEVYRAVSARIMQLFRTYTDLVEPSTRRGKQVTNTSRKSTNLPPQSDHIYRNWQFIICATPL